VIPGIFVVMTLVSWGCAFGITKLFRFNRRASNFVTAMAVFGNSNSLPISLVISLAKTIKGLHWDRIPGDNDEEVAARGILYLLIFQQLGQFVRWTWGFNYLLAPKDQYEEYRQERIEEGQADPASESQPQFTGSDETVGTSSHNSQGSQSSSSGDDVDDLAAYDPAGKTPVVGMSRTSPADSEDDSDDDDATKRKNVTVSTDNIHFPALPRSIDEISSFPSIHSPDEIDPPPPKETPKSRIRKCKAAVTRIAKAWYGKLPPCVRTVLAKAYDFFNHIMNPPLWAMVVAITIASVPVLQRLFFEDGSFVKNSFSDAVESMGGVAVPLILVVLGANLARNTAASESVDPEETLIGTKLLVASLLCRMLLPGIVMAPLLALFAKFAPISILDDPIFIIVCFLLMGAPSALQLAQICQLNSVYETVMAKVLFHSYVIW